MQTKVNVLNGPGGQLSAEQKRRIQLFEANAYLVAEIANRYTDFGVPLMRLMERAMTGFKISIEKYEEKYNQPFTIYASWWIKREICEEILRCNKRKEIPI